MESNIEFDTAQFNFDFEVVCVMMAEKKTYDDAVKQVLQERKEIDSCD